MENEKWKDIEGYEGLYQVSNLGRIKSLSKKKESKWGTFFMTKEIIRHPSLDQDGYLLITLTKNKIQKTYKCHQIVAKAFIPNPNNYDQINHIDEDKTNNQITNLEWCDCKYNVNYGTARERFIKTRGISVTNGINIYYSLASAAKDCNGTSYGIEKSCNSRDYLYKGYKWKYVERKQDNETVLPIC